MLASLLALNLLANPDLDEGRQLYDQMQFKGAEARLRLAREQASSDEELEEVLHLLARTLAAQRRLREAEDVYAELLAKAPNAKAPADVSPTLADVFERARERLYPRDFVRLRARPGPGAPSLTLVDPWSRVKSVVAVSEDGARRALGPSLSLEGLAARKVEALDQHGAVLASVELAAAPPAAVSAREPVEAVETTVAPARHRWVSWTLAALAVVAAGVGTGFAVAAADDYRASERQLWGSDAVTFGQRAQTRAIVANVCFAAVLVTGGTAAVLWAIRF